MFKALIVDDESIVRTGIRNSINWNEYDIEMIAEAENGIEALDEVMTDRPDLILLDICMPRMDGLEFASIVKKQFPGVHIVIITGFNDFTYAREAIRAGVDDYILKPITKKNVAEIVFEQIEKIKEERAAGAVAAAVSLPELVASLLTESRDTDHALDELSAALSISRGEAIRCVYVTSYSSDNDIFGNDDNLVRFSISNIADEILEADGKGRSITLQDGKVFMIIKDGDDVEDVVDDIRDNIFGFLKISVTCSVSGRGQLKDIKALHDSAVSARDYAFLHPEESIVFSDSITISDKEAFVYPMDIEHALLDNVTATTTDESERLLSEFFDRVLQGGLTEANTRNVLQRLSIGIADAIEFVNNRYMSDETRIYYDPFSVAECANADEALALFKKAFKVINAALSSLKNKTVTHYAKISDYIDNNYSDNELNLKKCSEDLFLSCSYINMILKKETGRTFVDLLNDKRISTAKQLLLGDDVRINEVAESVGFSHSTYFSTVFKKQTGMTPKAFIAKREH